MDASHLPRPDAGARLLRAADLAGTFLFAVEGALVAAQARLDLLGVAVVAFVASLGGGIVRDLLIGATPVAAVSDPLYVTAAVAGAGVTMVVDPLLRGPFGMTLLVLDAAGLSLFAVAGAEKALAFGLKPPIAAVLGMVTAAGGGAVRDVLLAQVPVVLRADFYATAALAGAVAVTLVRALGGSGKLAGAAGAVLCFTLRMVGALKGWHLPLLE